LAYLIPSPLGRARFEGRLGPGDRILFDGLQWWHPDEDAPADIIRRIVRGTAPPKGSARARIAAEDTREKAGGALLEATS
jgi:hypothetical protein